MHYPIKVAGLKRDLPLFPISDDLQIAAFILLGDQELTVACASALLEKAPEYDFMLTAEAKAFRSFTKWPARPAPTATSSRARR